MSIQQDDIISGSVTYTTQVGVYKIGTAAELQGNASATTGTLAYSTQFDSSRPIQIKVDNAAATSNWDDVENWTLNNVQITTTIPISVVSSSIVVPSTATVAITTGDLIGIFGPASWAISGSLNKNKSYFASLGSQNAGVAAGGYDGTNNLSNVELFNGSSWVTSTNTSYSVSSVAGAGTQNAAFIIAGANGAAISKSAMFNGSSWFASANLSTSRFDLMGCGSQNAALATGGLSGANTLSNTELFNGSSWSSSNNLSTSENALAGSGSQNACFAVGGFDSSNYLSITQLFNGSVWHLSANSSSTKRFPSSCGTQNAGLISGGDDGTHSLSSTELFNGSTWNASGNISQSKLQAGGCGLQSKGLIVGGVSGVTYFGTTELHNQTLYSKINYENIKSAKSIGVAYSVGATTCNIKFYGYIDNLSISSNNIAVTSAAQWVNTYWVLGRNSSNTQTTSAPNFTIAKAVPGADELKIGLNISQTQMQVFCDHLLSQDLIGRW